MEAYLKFIFASQVLTNDQVAIDYWLKKFLAMTLNLGKEAFVVHMAHQRAKILIYLAQKIQIALLIVKKSLF